MATNDDPAIDTSSLETGLLEMFDSLGIESAPDEPLPDAVFADEPITSLENPGQSDDFIAR